MEYKDGMMIVCQHGAQRIITFSMDAVVDGRIADEDVTVLVDSYDGKSLNSPNDMFIMGDMLFFTDPPYGMQGGENPDGTPRNHHDGAPQGTYQVFCYDMVSGDLSVVIDMADVGVTSIKLLIEKPKIISNTHPHEFMEMDTPEDSGAEKFMKI